MAKNDYFCKQNKKQYMLSAFKNYLNFKGIVIQKEDETTISFTYNDLYENDIYLRNLLF